MRAENLLCALPDFGGAQVSLSSPSSAGQILQLIHVKPVASANWSSRAATFGNRRENRYSNGGQLARSAKGLYSLIGVFELDGGSRRLFTYVWMDSIYTWQDALIFRNYLTPAWNQISAAGYQMACFDYKKQ